MELKKALLPIAVPLFPFIKRIKASGKPKIFGIGANKTGTTSLKAAIKNLGFTAGEQRPAENLIDDWAERDFRRIIKFCKSAQFFQDVPFSLDYTYIALDHAFPNSKFILTVRDSPEQWYESLLRFRCKMWGQNGQLPTKCDLQKATYNYEGWAWYSNRLIYHTPDDDLHNREILIQYYIRRNESIKEYFKHRPEDLLVLNVANESAYSELCRFLDVKEVSESFPWENKTH